MQRITITIILLLCLVFQGCKDHQQMLDQLVELERQNQADDYRGYEAGDYPAGGGDQKVQKVF